MNGLSIRQALAPDVDVLVQFNLALAKVCAWQQLAWYTGLPVVCQRKGV